MKIAFIGLGSMGAPQARLLARAGHDVVVYDPYPQALEKFKGIARLASSPADAATGVEAVGVCVRDDRQVEEVVFGPAGLAETMGPGTLLFIHSTISLETVESLHQRLTGKGVIVMDAAVTRTRATDDEPYVATLIGCDDSVIDQARAIVSAYSTDIVHAGGRGAGLALKVANNLVTWVQIIIGTQARDLAERSGVRYEALREVMSANGNLTPTMRALLDGQNKARPGDNPERDAFAASQAGNGEKDLSIAMDCATSHGLNTRVMEAARSVVRAAMTERA